MAKNNSQRSIYCPDEEWQMAKEIAWRKKTSVSSLIVELLKKSASEFVASSTIEEPPIPKTDEDLEL